MHLQRKEPPANGYNYIKHTCRVCGKEFYPAIFHQYVWSYRRFPRGSYSTLYVCSYTCDRRVARGEFNECLTTDTMPF